MADVKGLFQGADWKTEKHVPAIDAPASVNKAEIVKVTVAVGKQIPHPNTTEHHIRWVDIFFQAAGEKFPYQIGRYEFTSHGESALGVNTSTIYSVPEVTLAFKTDKSGTILASSYCNIHGLWQDSKEISVK